MNPEVNPNIPNFTISSNKLNQPIIGQNPDIKKFSYTIIAFFKEKSFSLPEWVWLIIPAFLFKNNIFIFLLCLILIYPLVRWVKHIKFNKGVEISRGGIMFLLVMNILLYSFALYYDGSYLGDSTIIKKKPEITPTVAPAPTAYNLYPSLTPTAAPIPQKIVDDYYKWYITCANTCLKKKNCSDLDECPFNKTGVLTQSLVDKLTTDDSDKIVNTPDIFQWRDVVLCAKVIGSSDITVNDINTGNTIIEGNKATVTVTVNLPKTFILEGNKGEKTLRENPTKLLEITVGLTLINNDWKMSSITCPAPEPTSTPEPTPLPTGLGLLDTKMSWGYDSEYNNVPIITAKLHNYNQFTDYKNVVIKVSFLKNPGSCLNADDNQYIKVSDYIARGDSQIIKTIVKTNFNTSGDWRWCAEIFNYDTANKR